MSQPQTTQQRLNISSTNRILYEFDLPVLLAPQINNFALSSTKINFKIKALKQAKIDKTLLITNLKWPPHIISKIKNLDTSLQSSAATNFINSEISNLNTKIDILEKEKSNIALKFKSVILETLTDFVPDPIKFFNRHEIPIDRIIQNRLLIHSLNFNLNVQKQKEEKEKIYIEKASHKNAMIIDNKVDSSIKEYIDSQLKSQLLSKKPNPNHPNKKVMANQSIYPKTNKLQKVKQIDKKITNSTTKTPRSTIVEKQTRQKGVRNPKKDF